MGLLDVLNGMQQGPRGPSDPNAQSSGGMSPITMASPNDLGRALGADQIDAVASQTGLSRHELLNGLSQYLPDVIDRLTPDGRLPTKDEL